MRGQTIKRALISVYDKTGITDFARALVNEFGIEIISTGGTAALLKASGVAVTLVEEKTGFPEMMDGRVKTLHPRVHAAILADRDNPKHMQSLNEQGIEPIDMVVVNLYPFEKTVADPDCTFEQAIEMIDIGGPCLLRAAAKNHKHVLVVSNAGDYGEILTQLRHTSPDSAEWARLRMRTSIEAFEATGSYDANVVNWLCRQAQPKSRPRFDMMGLKHRRELRYGENPHQQGEVLERIFSPSSDGDSAFLDAALDVDRQRRMSFNNYVDASSALELCRELRADPRLCVTGLQPVEGSPKHGGGWQPGSSRHQAEQGTPLSADIPVSQTRACVCVFIKHTNACGAGIADDPMEAYERAYLGDPKAAMGGILACDFDVSAGLATPIMETFDRWGKAAGAGAFFVEAWIAPRFDDEAREVIRSAKAWGKRVRLLAVGDMRIPASRKEREYKTITGGMLAQDCDSVGLEETEWKVVTQREPTDSEMADLRLAWLVCKHTKSNAVSICKDSMLIGNGAGQMSRVMSCRIATWLARENGHNDKLAGSAAASDGFFPFPDGPAILMDAGVTAIIQPGGSKHDADTVAACDKRGVAMILTGTRHFKH